MPTELDKDLSAFYEGRLSRRELLKRASALGLLAALPAGLAAEDARAEEPKRGGHLRIGSVQGSTTDTLDPATLSSGSLSGVSSRVCTPGTTLSSTN